MARRSCVILASLVIYDLRHLDPESDRIQRSRLKNCARFAERIPFLISRNTADGAEMAPKVEI